MNSNKKNTLKFLWKTSTFPKQIMEIIGMFVYGFLKIVFCFLFSEMIVLIL